MKSLLLMRHAEADAAAIGQDDRERVLSALGHAQASAAGRVLKRAKLLPDLALCSAVIRAHQTAQDLGSAAGLACSIETDDSLYSASAEHLLNLLSAQPDSAQQLLLVAHAPGVPELAAMLTTPSGRLSLACPPATLFHIELDCDSWSEISANSGIMRMVLPPQ